jgi:hypothetical protein
MSSTRSSGSWCGAPVIGASGALGVALAARAHRLPDGGLDEHAVRKGAARWVGSRPTAVNPDWAVERVLGRLPDGADARGGRTTGGVTQDGRFIALARFESEEAARRDSDRPEQDRWWSDAAKLFDGAVTFRDSSDVTVDPPGDPDRAGFVQIMQGHGTDPDRVQELMSQNADKWAEFRPYVLGTVAAAIAFARGAARGPARACG